METVESICVRSSFISVLWVLLLLTLHDHCRVRGFAPDLSVNLVKTEREFGGYNAAFIAPYYDMTT